VQVLQLSASALEERTRAIVWYQGQQELIEQDVGSQSLHVYSLMKAIYWSICGEGVCSEAATTLRCKVTVSVEQLWYMTANICFCLPYEPPPFA
jgi:hypothetical protein